MTVGVLLLLTHKVPVPTCEFFAVAVVCCCGSVADLCFFIVCVVVDLCFFVVCVVADQEGGQIVVAWPDRAELGTILLTYLQNLAFLSQKSELLREARTSAQAPKRGKEEEKRKKKRKTKRKIGMD